MFFAGCKQWKQCVVQWPSWSSKFLKKGVFIGTVGRWCWCNSRKSQGACYIMLYKRWRTCCRFSLMSGLMVVYWFLSCVYFLCMQ